MYGTTINAICLSFELLLKLTLEVSLSKIKKEPPSIIFMLIFPENENFVSISGLYFMAENVINLTILNVILYEM